MHPIEHSAWELLFRGEPFVLALIVRQKGATPRTAGSKMLVTRDGRGIGTIGGGSLEADVMRRAGRLIQNGRSELMHFDLSSDLVSSMDMICGGRADVLLSCVSATPANRDLFDQWHQMLQQNRRGCLVTIARHIREGIYHTTHCLVKAGGKMVGRSPLAQDDMETVLSAAESANRTQTLRFDQTLVVLEPANRAATAYLFGAGHVARPTARLAAMVGFRVWVLDDREAFANPERFPDAHRLSVLDGFERAFEDLEVTADSYVIIFTRGHLHDRIVLARALATDAGYIGMIGSRHKRNAIYDALRADGIPQAQIERVHCPIGLAIGAETPEEIAVSIVAEMISHRSKKKP
jgi:xanthine dehydrogenase accessory factor